MRTYTYTLTYTHTTVNYSYTSSVEEDDFAFPSLWIVVHSLHLASPSAGLGEANLQPIPHSLLCYGGWGIKEVDRLFEDIDMNLHNNNIP